MRPIDADAMLAELRPITQEMEHSAVTIADTSKIMRDWVKRQLTLTQPNEWISVDEKLPEDDAPKHKVQITVLVLTDREDVKIKNRTYHPARFYYGKFYPERWDWGTFNDDRITHWMPRPKPPGKDNNVSTKAPNEPLTIEQLREMDGEPVWCKELKSWALIYTEGGKWEPHLILPDLSPVINFPVKTHNRTYMLYRRPPERQEDT